MQLKFNYKLQSRYLQRSILVCLYIGVRVLTDSQNKDVLLTVVINDNFVSSSDKDRWILNDYNRPGAIFLNYDTNKLTFVLVILFLYDFCPNF